MQLIWPSAHIIARLSTESFDKAQNNETSTTAHLKFASKLQLANQTVNSTIWKLPVQEPKPQSGTSRVLQIPSPGLQGHEGSFAFLFIVES